MMAVTNGGPGTDGVTIQEFGFHLHDNLTALAGELQSGQYQPQPVERVWMPKPGP